MKPEQAALRSKTAGLRAPRAAETRPAVLGERSWAVTVATTIKSRSRASMPECRSASRPARVAMSATDSLSAMRRVWIPTLLRIHSSLVSTIRLRSSLVRTLSGWYEPTPVTRDPRDGETFCPRLRVAVVMVVPHVRSGQGFAGGRAAQWSRRPWFRDVSSLGLDFRCLPAWDLSLVSTRCLVPARRRKRDGKPWS